MKTMQNVYKHLDAILSLEIVNGNYYKSHPIRSDGRFTNMEKEVRKNAEAIRKRTFALEIGNKGPELQTFSEAL